MDGWTELTRMPVIRPPADPNATPPTATTAVFDETSDLVWVGDSTGYIGSYAENVLAPYTRFPAHEHPVLQILSHAKGILSTDGFTIRLTNRRGLTVFKTGHSSHEDLQNIKKMAYISPNELLIATARSLLRFDVLKATVTATLPYTGDVILIASNKRHIALGRNDGTIDIFDPRTNSIVINFQSSTGTLSDIDLREHTLVSCGYSRRHGTFALDPLVNVYDLRAMRALSPIPFPAGASFVRLHPRLSSVAIIASKTGQIQVVDMFNPSAISLYQADVGPMILSFELCSTGDYLAIIDAYSLLHLWAHSPEHATMSGRTPLEYPSIPDQNTHQIDINDEEVPLNSIGLPYYKETLLSAWPSQTIFRSAGTIPKPIDPSIYQNSKLIDGLTIAPYDKEKYGRRNQAKKYVPVVSSSDSAKFLSTKNTASPAKRPSNKKETNIFDFKNDSDPNVIPNAFQKLEILYSRFGVDDFDFDAYNITRFSGLETHVDNSYTNSLLQLYRFVPEIFSFMLGNLATENFESDSLLRELGYLFDMLHKSNGKNFRPTNFQTTLSNIPEANQLGLVQRENDSSPKSNNHTEISRIQLFNRYLLDKIANDEVRSKMAYSATTYFDRLVAIEVETRTRSLFSGAFQRNINITRSLEVFSPLSNSLKPILKNASQPSIIAYIESSMNRIEQNRVLNQVTGQVEVLEISNVVTSLPPVLSINLHLNTEEKKSIRNIKNWLKPKFHAANTKNGFILTENVRSLPTGDFFTEFELVGFVAEISGESNKDRHLVTFVKVYDDVKGSHNWHMFNDFLVIEIPESEVFNLSYWWKTPVSLVYRLNNPNDIVSNQFSYDAWKIGLNDEILYRDYFANGFRESRRIEYEILTREEAPKPGSLIAIDAEFVTLEEEQFEIKANGTRSLLKPSNQTLARVSVLRGDPGEKFGVPFIDDYVVVNEEGIHDYLTSYSGIEPGDLDPNLSDKSLVTREVAYRKLWLLLNLGCVFVGHGLTKDFRTINISVPKTQVRDTAVFFYKGQRILSLKFLSYVLLNKRVQTGNHDSIEDAHTALLLYREYLKMKDMGSFEEVLDYIYSEGQALKFKPPGEDY